MIETSRLRATDNLNKYHVETRAWRDKRVVQKDISPGDMVLIRHPVKQGKLQSQWYSPFIVASMIKPGTYRLMNDEGVKMDHTWNTDNMHRFYPQNPFSACFLSFFLLIFMQF